jgi:hypothetical protein
MTSTVTKDSLFAGCSKMPRCKLSFAKSRSREPSKFRVVRHTCTYAATIRGERSEADEHLSAACQTVFEDFPYTILTP